MTLKWDRAGCFKGFLGGKMESMDCVQKEQRSNTLVKVGMFTPEAFKFRTFCQKGANICGITKIF
jgi:hypothetical protein